MKRKLYLVLFLLGFTGCASAPVHVAEDITPEEGEYVQVTAEGTADIREAGISEATDRAYMDAQRKAIEKALGRMYSARTIVEAGRFIEQSVMADTKGYIRRWDKTGGPETRNYPGTDEKIIWVQIDAEVGLDKLRENTLALEETQKRLGRPDIAIILDDPHAKNAVTSTLNEKQFTVKEPGSDIDDIFGYALNNNIEIIIKGKAVVKKGGKIMEGVDMVSYQANVSLQALNAADGEIIAEASAHGAYPHIEDESGKAGAARKAGKAAAEELSAKMISAWEDILNNGSSIYLKIKGVSLKDESRLKQAFSRGIRGIREIHTKDFTDGVLRMKIMYLGDSKQLAQDIDSLSTVFNLRVTGYKANIIEVEME